MTSLLVVSILIMKNMNPISLALSILFLSILTSLTMFKQLSTSWMSFVIILTFSSGMMTLFMYTASLTSNEINKLKKWKFPWIVLVLSMTAPLLATEKNVKFMKSFSNQLILIVTAIFLIITMLAISLHGHHPSQTLSTSF